MAILSLDIGTNKICALVMDEHDRTVLEIKSAENVFLDPVHSGDRQQDPERIFLIAASFVSELINKYKTFRSIGVTCQMHGILYVNAAGKAVSPLYTWQDQCAALPYDNEKSYAAYLAKFSPGPIAPGYGLASCFYHLKNRLIPRDAKKLCTIGDYVVMRLCNAAQPVMHRTNAAGLGFFDLENSRFDEKAMEKAGLDISLLPEISGRRAVSDVTVSKIPVCVSVGDNQASFLGAVRNYRKSILANIGTGSQISMLSSDPVNPGVLETRPFFDGLFLMAGSSLCGGRAYAILEKFFRKVLAMAGIENDDALYPFMNALAFASPGENLTVNTLFAGSREDPSLRGSITNILEDNFTPAHLISGFLNGMADELYNFYQSVREREAYTVLVGSGNGIRKNEALRRILSEKFDMPLELSPYEEEAAYGAALFARACVGSSDQVLV